MNKTVLERLQRILGQRKAHPWGASVGWNRGVIDRLRAGTVPGHEFLGALARAENVNLNWLIAGDGAPFRVSICRNDREAAELVAAHLQDAADWAVYLLRSGDRTAIAMTLPATYLLKGKEYPYTVLELITGDLGPRTLLALQEHRLNRSPEIVDISTEEMQALERGELGTWALAGEGGLLLRRGHHSLQTTLNYVADGKQTYTTFTLAGQRERRLIEKLRELPDEDLEMVENLVTKLPTKPKDPAA